MSYVSESRCERKCECMPLYGHVPEEAIGGSHHYQAIELAFMKNAERNREVSERRVPPRLDKAWFSAWLLLAQRAPRVPRWYT